MMAKAFDLFLSLVISRSWRRSHLERVQGRVLEVGGGSGLSLSCYPHTGWNGLVLLDLDQEMLALAAQRKLPGGQPITVCQGNVEALPFEDGAFDTIVAQFLFCGVGNPVQGLRECRRVLAPEGRLFLLEHVRSDNWLLGPLLDAVNVLTSRLFADRFNQRIEPLLEEAGWRVVERRELFLDVIRLVEATPQEEQAAKS
ncbi:MULTISPECIES: class I SAM-dependent methyltransferase [Sporomusaceae]|uniref:class I SAM-dependent methyltransferase n=1 Tax=Sporomusaceae TaxID=1843490 RepID=UPI00035FB9A8|nr:MULTISPECIES: methyltransferase domain-containing protein [Sporomusaceae]